MNDYISTMTNSIEVLPADDRDTLETRTCIILLGSPMVTGLIGWILFSAAREDSVLIDEDLFPVLFVTLGFGLVMAVTYFLTRTASKLITIIIALSGWLVFFVYLFVLIVAYDNAIGLAIQDLLIIGFICLCVPGYIVTDRFFNGIIGLLISGTVGSMILLLPIGIMLLIDAAYRWRHGGGSAVNLFEDLLIPLIGMVLYLLTTTGSWVLARGLEQYAVWRALGKGEISTYGRDELID